ncbi:MAG TPA: MATE family efflux transporter [Candidatus Diapherotrites archaeon]|uniref:Multidrug-efflux transporter n=1 Tax=Candidatus Iainarchaeum sp. TaxID=3101447 RepID=A0A7J4JGE3_9ARCH|nr:MATE family efflux transporter [Candidatus Diapherotrites archaeon]HIH16190.1 MATE family efflux transporter [Candidatus Diapherotrites archaeon]
MTGERVHKGLDLTQGRVLHNLLAMGIPVSIGFMFETSYNVVDTMFVGGLGVNALAALSMSFPLYFIILSIGIGLSVGSNALVAQAIGAKDYKKADNLAEHSFLVAAVVGLLVTFLGFYAVKPFYLAFGASPEVLALGEQYMFWILLNTIPFYFTFVAMALLRAEGEAMIPLYALAGGAILNVFLDWIFIYGLFGLPVMGVAGAGFATFLADVAAVGFFAFMLLGGRRRLLRFKPRDFSPRFGYAWQLLVKGVPASVGQVITAGGFTLLMALVGGFGAEAVAAYGVGIRIDQLVVLPSIGIATAVTSIVGQNIGARKLKRVEWTVNSALKLLFAVELAGGALVFALAGPLMGLFTSDLSVVNLGVAYVSTVALTYCFRAGMIVIASAFQGAGEMLKALVMMASFYGLAFALAYAFTRSSHDLSLVWMSIAASTLLSFALSYAMYARKMWVPKALRA